MGGAGRTRGRKSPTRFGQLQSETGDRARAQLSLAYRPRGRREQGRRTPRTGLWRCQNLAPAVSAGWKVDGKRPWSLLRLGQASVETQPGCWSGAAHPDGALLPSCSLSKPICCWWKGAPLPPPIPTLLERTHSPHSPNSPGRCWEVKPSRLVPPSYLLTPQSCLAHCHSNLPPQPWCCVPALPPLRLAPPSSFHLALAPDNRWTY